jgi:hypothetical protein
MRHVQKNPNSKNLNSLELMRQNNFRIFKEQRADLAIRDVKPHMHRTRRMCRSTSPADRVGGASRDRTDDPLLAKQVLSQLSYGP